MDCNVKCPTVNYTCRSLPWMSDGRYGVGKLNEHMHLPDFITSRSEFSASQCSPQTGPCSTVQHRAAGLGSYLLNGLVSGDRAEQGWQLSHVHFGVLAHGHGWIFLRDVFALLHLLARLLHLQLRIPGWLGHADSGGLALTSPVLAGHKHNNHGASSGVASEANRCSKLTSLQRRQEKKLSRKGHVRKQTH